MKTAKKVVDFPVKFETGGENSKKSSDEALQIYGLLAALHSMLQELMADSSNGSNATLLMRKFEEKSGGIPKKLEPIVVSILSLFKANCQVAESALVEKNERDSLRNENNNLKDCLVAQGSNLQKQGRENASLRHKLKRNQEKINDLRIDFVSAIMLASNMAAKNNVPPCPKREIDSNGINWLFSDYWKVAFFNKFDGFKRGREIEGF